MGNVGVGAGGMGGLEDVGVGAGGGQEAGDADLAGA